MCRHKEVRSMRRARRRYVLILSVWVTGGLACSDNLPEPNTRDAAPIDSASRDAAIDGAGDAISTRDGGAGDGFTGDGLVDDSATPDASITCDDNDDCIALSKDFCAFPLGDCGESERGKCEEEPTVCPLASFPVCGCDAITYDNRCHAAQAGVSIRHEGACTSNCDKLDSLYKNAVSRLKDCDPQSDEIQCSLEVPDSLFCACPTFVNQPSDDVTAGWLRELTPHALDGPRCSRGIPLDAVGTADHPRRPTQSRRSLADRS